MSRTADETSPGRARVFRGGTFRWLAVGVWALVLFGLSSIPGGDLPTTSVPSADKWVHLSLYGILGVLCFRAVQGSFGRLSRARIVVSAVAIVLGYGISDELHQIWVPRRSPDPMDVAADLAGGIIGASAASWWSRRQANGVRRRAKPANRAS